MKVHSINIRSEDDAFVLTAEKRMPLDGARVWAEGREISCGDWYQPASIEICLSNPQDVAVAVGKLLKDGLA